MEGQGFDLFGVVEGKDDLVIVDEHRVQEDLDEPLLAVNVSVVHAVYDIGDGTMDWQLRAESSLFYHKYGSFETKADGMILVCADGRRNEIAKQIIRHPLFRKSPCPHPHHRSPQQP